MTTRKKTTSNKRGENKGTEYEKLVESVFTGLLKLEGEHFRNLRIERNVRLDAITRKPDGTPVKRQIDVYWEFEIAGIAYRTVIQAKNWTQPIDLPVIDTFKNVLSDLPGQPKGIIVTRVGCGDGEALAYAKAQGISIYLLNEADSSLWGGTIPTLDCDVSVLIVRTDLVQLFTEPTLSEDDLARWRQALSRPSDEINVLDEQGNVKGTAEQLRAEFIQLHRLTPGPQELLGTFKVPFYIEAEDKERFKLEGIKVTLENRVLVPTTRIFLTISHVLQLATGDATYTVDNNFKLRKLGEPLTETIFQQTGTHLKTLDQLFSDAQTPRVSEVG
ncbi:MAG: hypothetical protein J0M35_01835 [Candidatus Obscuribacter phosphatis]|uniref:Restriction endonuclease type IV Mrr domain-containing protein n=1 Tax=Candidatus Obscuribacter phosphatis TaxID=1906157 RepID=A0A8J7P6V8_9BACT|nr:hypothetical protein [Candidatus Obscuribacter phosphatis]